MPKTPYKNDGVISIQVQDRALGQPVGFHRPVEVHIPLIRKRLTPEQRVDLERGYSIALATCLRTLKHGLDAATYSRINPLLLTGIAASYQNTAWDGWAQIETWAPKGTMTVTFNSFFGMGFHSLGSEFKTGMALTIGAIAAGLAFCLSSIAITDIPDIYGSTSNRVIRGATARLSRSEAVKSLLIPRRKHNRIHLHRKLLEKEHCPLAIAKVLLHEAAHAYSGCNDYYYMNNDLLNAPTNSGAEVLHTYEIDNFGEHLTQKDRIEFQTSRKLRTLLLLENADTLAHFIFHFGREGSRSIPTIPLPL